MSNDCDVQNRISSYKFVMRGTLNIRGTKYYLRITSQVPGLADGRLAGVGMYHCSVLSAANFPGAVSLNNFPNLNTWLRRPAERRCTAVWRTRYRDLHLSPHLTAFKAMSCRPEPGAGRGRTAHRPAPASHLLPGPGWAPEAAFFVDCLHFLDPRPLQVTTTSS